MPGESSRGNRGRNPHPRNQGSAEESSMSKPLVPMACIAQATTEITGVGKRDLVGAGRTRHVAFARFYAFYIARELGYSYRRIGIFFGRRDHSTIIHGMNVA